ncbi:MAG TPA: conjugal transfer protein TrbF [Alphaproteobacteria bacterium]|nr:conjugal transfer protein TrbF [Alphaproteobacteria bacterium]
MHPFHRSVHRYARTEAPETPYQRAAQVWDDRIGSARVQARNWRAMAFGLFALGATIVADDVHVRSHTQIVPWVVEVDRLGNARASGPADPNFQPSDPQIANQLARFTVDWRALSIDPIVVRQNWLEAYEFATDRGAATLNEWARVNDPFAKVGQRSVSIEVTSVVRASDSSFQVKWTETAYDAGSLVSSDRFTAIYTIVHKAPPDQQAFQKNPLGIYVNGVNWSRELG